MEYVIFKGKDQMLYTYDRDTAELNYFDEYTHQHIYLPSESPCDLELFRDTLCEVLTEIIRRKRSGNERKETDM